MRTPTMTVAECESALGPRGNTRIDSTNRPTARQWLIANGFPAIFSHGRTISELDLAYNSVDGSGLDVLRSKYENGPAPDAPAPAAPAAPAIIEAPAPAAPARDPAQLLRDLLLEGYTPGLDESRVRAIVQESIADIAPRVIEIRKPDHAPVRLAGITHPQFERCLRYLTTQGPNGYNANVLLVGPAGCGKTYLVSQIAKALSCDHTIVGGSAGATEGDIIGRLLPGQGGAFEYVPSEWVRLYERGNAVLALDEMDGFDANMLMCANMPLANGSMFVHLRRDRPEVLRGARVFLMATANTFGTGANPIYAGRNQLDAATLDRFITISVDYDHTLEESIGVAGGLSSAEMAGIWELRDRCREASLRRVIGTRAFQKAAVMKLAGDSWREIRDRILEGWTRDEKAKVGV